DRRPLLEVLGTGVVTGAIAGLAAGMIDALWSWRAAARAVGRVVAGAGVVLFAAGPRAPGAGAAGGGRGGAAPPPRAWGRARGAAGIGDLLRFGWREHVARRARDPREAVAGLAIAIATVPCLAIALWATYRMTVPYIAGRKVVGLVVVVVMGATLAAAAGGILV